MILTRERGRAAKYGLTLCQLIMLRSLQESNGYVVCALCPRVLARPTDQCIDHDHDCCPSGRCCGHCIRGILCKGCNSNLDRPSMTRRPDVVSYLNGPRIGTIVSNTYPLDNSIDICHQMGCYCSSHPCITCGRYIPPRQAGTGPRDKRSQPKIFCSDKCREVHRNASRSPEERRLKREYAREWRASNPDYYRDYYNRKRSK